MNRASRVHPDKRRSQQHPTSRRTRVVCTKCTPLCIPLWRNGWIVRVTPCNGFIEKSNNP